MPESIIIWYLPNGDLSTSIINFYTYQLASCYNEEHHFLSPICLCICSFLLVLSELIHGFLFYATYYYP